MSTVSTRKFDIRVFALFVSHARTGKIRGYFYDEGYLRTSSKEFSLDRWDSRMVHLTNDAVQKISSDLLNLQIKDPVLPANELPPK